MGTVVPVAVGTGPASRWCRQRTVKDSPPTDFDALAITDEQ